MQQLESLLEAYSTLDAFLIDAPQTTTRPHNIPVGPKAFMRGVLVHTNELKVSLGANYFVDRSAPQAREIVQRRRAYVQECIDAQRAETANDSLRAAFAKDKDAALHRLVDPDGDEVNEEGLKFIDIREEVDDQGNALLDQKALAIASSDNTPLPSVDHKGKTPVSFDMPVSDTPIIVAQQRPSNPSKPSATTATADAESNLGSFEREFLQKLERMEREEEGGEGGGEESGSVVPAKLDDADLEAGVEANVDVDGDEVNEEGLKFVDIREDEHEEVPEAEEVAHGTTDTASSVDRDLTNLESKLGSFEREILEKLDRMEREESAFGGGGGGGDVVGVVQVGAGGGEKSADVKSDEMDEHQLPVFEILEELDANGTLVSMSADPVLPIPISSPQPPTPSRSLGTFENTLLARLDRLEMEECEDQGHDTESDRGEEEEDEYEKGLQEFSSGFREDDDDDDFNDGVVDLGGRRGGGKAGDGDDTETESEEGEGGSEDEEREVRRKRRAAAGGKGSSRDVGVLPVVGKGGVVGKSHIGGAEVKGKANGVVPLLPAINNPGDFYKRMKFVVDAAAAVAASEKESVKKDSPTGPDSVPPPTSIFLKDKITDRGVDSDDDDDVSSMGSQDLEDYLFGREIAKEYHERRQVLLAQQVKIVDKMGDDVKERLDIAEEDRTESVFRSQRLGFPSDSAELEIREYIENQKREEEMALHQAQQESLAQSTAAAAALASQSEPQRRTTPLPPAPLKSSLAYPEYTTLPAGEGHTKPRFKPVVKAKKSVSFSQECLDAEEEVPVVYDFQGVGVGGGRVPPKVKKAGVENGVGGAKGGKEAGVGVAVVGAKVKETVVEAVAPLVVGKEGDAAGAVKVSKFKEARRAVAAVVMEKGVQETVGPGVVAPVVGEREAMQPRVSKFKADRQGIVAEEVAVSEPVVSRDVPKVSQFKMDRQAVAASVPASVPGASEMPKVSKFKGARQAGASVAPGSANASESVVAAVTEDSQPRVSKFKADRQAAVAPAVPAVNASVETTREPPKVSKFKAARQAGAAVAPGSANASESVVAAVSEDSQPRVSKFKADRQAAVAPAVPVVNASVDATREPPKVSKFKAARQAGGAAAAATPGVAPVSASVAVSEDSQPKVSKFKAARQAGGIAAVAVAPVSANVTESAVAGDFAPSPLDKVYSRLREPPVAAEQQQQKQRVLSKHFDMSGKGGAMAEKVVSEQPIPPPPQVVERNRFAAGAGASVSVPSMEDDVFVRHRPVVDVVMERNAGVSAVVWQDDEEEEEEAIEEGAGEQKKSLFRMLREEFIE
ncbi:uri1, prefoldin-like chaperone [Podochytrium sp. JEL0797]|nr:uri1, prefoldin-like chaperone [Podochytrium sp. JEL0797]